MSLLSFQSENDSKQANLDENGCSHSPTHTHISPNWIYLQPNRAAIDFFAVHILNSVNRHKTTNIFFHNVYRLRGIPTFVSCIIFFFFWYKHRPKNTFHVCQWDEHKVNGLVEATWTKCLYRLEFIFKFFPLKYFILNEHEHMNTHILPTLRNA